MRNIEKEIDPAKENLRALGCLLWRVIPVKLAYRQRTWNDPEILARPHASRAE